MLLLLLLLLLLVLLLLLRLLSAIAALSARFCNALPVPVEKHTPPEKHTHWNASFQSIKSCAGLQSLLPDCRARACKRGVFFSQTPVSLGGWKPHRDSLARAKPVVGLNLLLHARNTEGYGFVAFEISSSTISTVFRQPLTTATDIYIYIYNLSIYLSIYPSICISIYSSLSLSLYIYIYIHTCV